MELPRSTRRSTLVGSYILGDEIGKGAYGQVYKAIDKRDGRVVAIKEIPLAGIDEASLAGVRLEIDLLGSLSHPNVVGQLGTIRTPSYFYIVLEYCEAGSLAASIKANKFGPAPEALCKVYVAQVLDALAYLHSPKNGIVHRDVKGANLLATKDGCVKLADFGSAARMGEDGRGARPGLGNAPKKTGGGSVDDDAPLDVVGTPYWMAPEVIEMSGTKSDPKSDVWSVACVVVELLTGSPPYFDLQPMPALFAIVRDESPPLPPGISPELRGFLTACFRKDPAQRPTASELRSHEWLEGVATEGAAATVSSSGPARRAEHLALDDPKPDSAASSLAGSGRSSPAHGRPQSGSRGHRRGGQRGDGGDGAAYGRNGQNGDGGDDGAVGEGARGTRTRTVTSPSPPSRSLVGRARRRRSPGLSPGLSRAAPAQEEERGPAPRRIDATSAAASASELGMLAAASDGNKTAVYRHVSRGGASLGAADQSGDTALHRAARGGCVGLIKTVLKAAGKPWQPSRRELMDATNAAGRTPLQVAVDAKRVKAARFLRREGSADPRGELDALNAFGCSNGYASSSGYSSSAVSDTLSDTGSSDAGSESDLASDSDAEFERAGTAMHGGLRGRGTKGLGGSRTWAGHGAPATFDYSAYGRLGTSEYATSDATSAALEDVAGGETSSSTSRAELARRWIRSLPSKRRERLERRLERAAGEGEVWTLVAASAEGDVTKVRAELRREVLEARA
mmetsp:Transcript_9969/g.45121  ORF Transcript_9969/g.45121 Transcript_9969/m.45121 type:complete len:737 (+) Transcript_9969:83-2293(+)